MRQTRTDLSLPATLRQGLSRRQAISLLGGIAGAAALTACAGGGETVSTVVTPSPTPTPGTPSPSPTPTTGSCTKVAEETAGPFPADGSNSNKNVLTDPNALRSNINGDIGADSTTAQAGTPLTVIMTVQNVNGSCAKLANAYVYLWHANNKGSYSQYSGNNNGGDFTANTFHRGVQRTDANGVVTFVTRFPGRYAGRATHMHFEVFPTSFPMGTSNASSSMKIATSQLAFPAAVTEGSASPYANTTLYPNSASNNTTNERDNVFSDGTSTEMLTITGNNTDGYVATITVSVSA